MKTVTARDDCVDGKHPKRRRGDEEGGESARYPLLGHAEAAGADAEREESAKGSAASFGAGGNPHVQETAADEEDRA